LFGGRAVVCHKTERAWHSAFKKPHARQGALEHFNPVGKAHLTILMLRKA